MGETHCHCCRMEQDSNFNIPLLCGFSEISGRHKNVTASRVMSRPTEIMFVAIQNHSR